MNYKRIYDNLVQKALERGKPNGYFEKHHIVPKCVGGENTKGNLVLFTAKEHFVAHKLLTKLYPSTPGIWYALIAMGRIQEFKSRIFESERLKAYAMRKGFKYSDESKKKMSLAKLGKPSPSPKTTFAKGITPWNAGKRGSEHHMFGTRRTPEQRKKMGEAQKLCGNVPPSRKGIKWTEEQKRKAQETRAFNKQIKLLGEMR